jgi:hypothetical protein
MTGREKTPKPMCVLAWSLAEGDLFPGGEMVLLVRREPATGVVDVFSDDGSRRQLGREDRVMLTRRPTWRVPRFAAGIEPELLESTRPTSRGPFITAVLPRPRTGSPRPMGRW